MGNKRDEGENLINSNDANFMDAQAALYDENFGKDADENVQNSSVYTNTSDVNVSDTNSSTQILITNNEQKDYDSAINVEIPHKNKKHFKWGKFIGWSFTILVILFAIFTFCYLKFSGLTYQKYSKDNQTSFVAIIFTCNISNNV